MRAEEVWYFRFNPPTTEDVDLAEYREEKLAQLEADVERYLRRAHISVLVRLCAQLLEKLELASFPERTPLSDDWAYGVPLNDIKRLYTALIHVDGFDPLKIHFVHKKASRQGAIPLLFCHGCDFIEVSKILPLLANPERDDQPCFDVVAPSLPNFGFSSAPSKPGFGTLSNSTYAECCHKLMPKLGYSRYVTQGGNWEYAITRSMGIKYGPAASSSLPATVLATKRKRTLARTKWFYEQGFAYNHVQSHNPSTIGPALRDSPVALLAWIYEKLHNWTDSYSWTDGKLLTWISIYQFSEAGPEAACRIYYEHVHPFLDMRLLQYNPGVKLGLSTFPRDLIVSPRHYGQTLGPVVLERRHEEGGHFAAWEVPKLLVDDVRAIFAGLMAQGELTVKVR
ncbi:Alpha/Beta hydrolase protein [Apiosordaria backusii]|uniref:Alpha/Beta hydrolase protein n=1 Tax=Apiosordaria backusii TaxID=314023 RepID=A0AA40EXA2_9PEZI|nr:Alpha/Beta hydrolase protein [Apiosordaria backusii]